jgi:hypothetical protein
MPKKAKRRWMKLMVAPKIILGVEAAPYPALPLPEQLPTRLPHERRVEVQQFSASYDRFRLGTTILPLSGSTVKSPLHQVFEERLDIMATGFHRALEAKTGALGAGRTGTLPDMLTTEAPEVYMNR